VPGDLSTEPSVVQGQDLAGVEIIHAKRVVVATFIGEEGLREPVRRAANQGKLDLTAQGAPRLTNAPGTPTVVLVWPLSRYANGTTPGWAEALLAPIARAPMMPAASTVITLRRRRFVRLLPPRDRSEDRSDLLERRRPHIRRRILTSVRRGLIAPPMEWLKPRLAALSQAPGGAKWADIDIPAILPALVFWRTGLLSASALTRPCASGSA
jgi:hypothetical protein